MSLELCLAIMKTSRNHEHDLAMLKIVSEIVKLIYEDFSKDELLMRCSNFREHFNAIVWSIVLKSVSTGKTAVNLQ